MKYIKNYSVIFENNKFNSLYNEISFNEYLDKFENVEKLSPYQIGEIVKFFKKYYSKTSLYIDYITKREYTLISEVPKPVLFLQIDFNEKQFAISIGEIKDEYFIVKVLDTRPKFYICDSLDGVFQLFRNLI